MEPMESTVRQNLHLSKAATKAKNEGPRSGQEIEEPNIGLNLKTRSKRKAQEGHEARRKGTERDGEGAY